MREGNLREVITVQMQVINQQNPLLLRNTQDVEVLQDQVRGLMDTQGRLLGNPIIIEDDDDDDDDEVVEVAGPAPQVVTTLIPIENN